MHTLPPTGQTQHLWQSAFFASSFPPFVECSCLFCPFLFLFTPTHKLSHAHAHSNTSNSSDTQTDSHFPVNFHSFVFFAETRNFTCLLFLPLPSPTSKPRFLFSKGRTGCPVPPHLNLAWLGSRPPTPQSNRTLKKEKEKREETRRQRGPCDYGATMLCSRCMGKTGRVLDLRKSSNITTNDG